MTKLKKWKLLKEEDVSPSKWFPLYRHEVKLPNGQLVDDYYVSKLGDVSMIVPITKKKELIFVRQYKHGAGNFVTEFPAGRIGNNSPERGAQLELKEETGYIADKLIYLGTLHQTPSKDTAKISGFLAPDLEKIDSQEFDETEEIEILKVPLKKVEDFVKGDNIGASDTLAFLHLAMLKEPKWFR